jgi:uracil-DNA glycosylase
MADVFGLDASWQEALKAEFDKEYVNSLLAFLEIEKAAGKTIYPAEDEYFNALKLTPLDNAKVVIVGQDPYHGAGQAHGLSFSVKPNLKVPPSLLNIFKEQQEDLGISQPNSGCLVPWAEQGVLLLNAVLSVEAQKAGSHQGKGWENFTDAIVDALNNKRDGLVFILWGSYAQKKGAKIDRDKHLVLEGPHPSPLSAYRGFFGCRHFSKANAYLVANGAHAIDWQLPRVGELPL